MPREGVLPKDSITQLREKLDYAEFGQDGQKQRRHTDLNDELRVFVRRFQTATGLDGVKLVDWKDPAHQAGLDELTAAFLDKHGYGDMYWPESNTSSYRNTYTYKANRSHIWDHVKQIFWRMNSLSDRNQKHKNKKNLAELARKTESAGTRSPSSAEPQRSATASTFPPPAFPWDNRTLQPRFDVEDSSASRTTSPIAPVPPLERPTSSTAPEAAPAKSDEIKPQQAQPEEDQPSTEARRSRLKRPRDKGFGGRGRGGKRAKTQARIPGERASPRQKRKPQRAEMVEWKEVPLDSDTSQTPASPTVARKITDKTEGPEEVKCLYDLTQDDDDENDGDYTPSIPVDPKLAVYSRPAREDETPGPVPPSPSTTVSDFWASYNLIPAANPPNESLGDPLAPEAPMGEMAPPSRSGTMPQTETELRMPPTGEAPRNPPPERPATVPVEPPAAALIASNAPQPTTHPAGNPAADPAAGPAAEPAQPPAPPPSNPPKRPPQELPKHSEPTQPAKLEPNAGAADTKPRAKPSVDFVYRVVFSRTPIMVSRRWSPQGRFQDKSLAELLGELPFGPQAEGLVFTIAGPGYKTIERLPRGDEVGFASMKRFINDYIREWMKAQRQRQLAGGDGAAPHLAVDILIESMADENSQALDDQLLKAEEEEDLDIDW